MIQRKSLQKSCVRLSFVASLFWNKSLLSTAFFVHGGQQGNPLRALSAESSSTRKEDEDFFQNVNGGSNRSRKPATGWNHNLPSQSSKFWRQGRESTNDSSTAATNELRTGWLHNSAPRQSKSTEEPSSTTAPKAGNLARRRLEMAKRQQERNHRILAPPTFHPGGGDTVVVVTEHLVSVPLYRGEQSSERIDVYFSIVEPLANEDERTFLASLQDVSPRQRADAYVSHKKLSNMEDSVLYLQGGPGFGAPTPVVGLGVSKGCGSWADAALYQCGYKRIVLMDQRGTGRSTPITKQTLESRFPGLFALDQEEEASEPGVDRSSSWKDAVEQATQFMAQFRADNIVFDAEYIREALLYEDVSAEEEEKVSPKPWGCSLGQSFGGFCSMTYLSKVAHPPKIMLLTGGIAPMLDEAIHVYGLLWERVRERNRRYYEMYPGDIILVKKIVQKLLNEPQSLPSGGLLTARRFLLLGIALGGSPTSFANFHELLNSAVLNTVEADTDISDLVFKRSFLKRMDSAASFDDNPIYFLMHEAIYADGPENSPTMWAAERSLDQKIEHSIEFNHRETCLSSSDSPVLFFGEHVFSWMAHDFAELGGAGLQALSQALAEKTDWGSLYDADHMKSVLNDSRTRAAAAVYYEDMYVEFQACSKVVAPGGPLERCKLYVTNEYQHSGLRDNGGEIFAKLHGMAKGGVQTPS